MVVTFTKDLDLNSGMKTSIRPQKDFGFIVEDGRAALSWMLETGRGGDIHKGLGP
mgnify:CR=1 FL=1